MVVWLYSTDGFMSFYLQKSSQTLKTDLKKKGIFFILLGRHFIGLRTQIFIVSGIMRMHPLKFLLTDAVAVTFTIAVMCQSDMCEVIA